VPSGSPLPAPVAEAALAYLRRRTRLLVRLTRVEQALCRWDAWDMNALLPDDLQRPMTPPILHREGLDGLHRMLTEALVRLDGSHCADP
jgi:hypothetical protein